MQNINMIAKDIAMET